MALIVGGSLCKLLLEPVTGNPICVYLRNNKSRKHAATHCLIIILLFNYIPLTHEIYIGISRQQYYLKTV